MKSGKIVKYLNGDKYIFIGGKAVVPGIRHLGQPVTVTIKEFNELKE